MTTSGFTVADHKLLEAALKAGLELELEFTRDWSSEDPQNDVLSPAYRLKMAEDKFRDCLLRMSDGEHALVKKLSELASKVDAKLGPRHLMALLVPLERLSGRAARDEEFLFSEQDGNQPSTNAAEIKSRLPRIVICENLRSAFNVGAIYRTSEAFQANEVWLTGYTADPLKTAMGTDKLLTVKNFDRTEIAIAALKESGFSVIALENAPGAEALETFQWPEKSAVILGNERFGVDSQTLKKCDHVVRISTLGSKNSLNVGISFGIAANRWREVNLVSSEIELLHAIGKIEGGHSVPQAAPRQANYGESASQAWIRLYPRFQGRPGNFEQALQSLAGFERVWLVFGFHESQGWLPMVRPPRGDGEKRGVFATRSPHRPNRIGLSSVRLLKVEGRNLLIEGHDLLDETPIYDIKPYLPQADSFPEAKAGWVDELPEPYSIEESAMAEEKLDWLESNGENRLRGFIEEQLRYQPLDQSRKRVSEITTSSLDSTTHFQVAFRTWRMSATISESPVPTLKIMDVASGYTAFELADFADPHGDKTLHRLFGQTFSTNGTSAGAK
ncbi:MAG: tRNA (N6-threonylcarbamoyladenosine(37)-N6)-methyltransferase TrmO [Deltaproteobacteria bacterium]|nr:tRNA (N6-threonylcarbamoyladenosine(37)-N6)-methyltransferase TrmO [Deltaproteobacteria bacterium]